MPLRNVATTFTIEQQRLEINNLAGDVNNIANGTTTVGTATTASALAAGATGADLTLSGTLTVNGTQTILNTETLQVEDKEIVIGNVSSPTDATANGGGWKLKGADNKTITYNQTGDKWESNKNFEAPNLVYKTGDQTFSGNLTIDTGTAATIDWGDIDGNAHGRLYADSTGTFIGSKTFQKLSLRTNNTERLNINADGNNTSLISPNWNVFEIRTGGSHDAIIKLTDGDNGTSSVKGEIRWDHSDQKLEIGAGDNTNHLTINSGGDVVITEGYLQIDPTDHDKLKLKVPSGASDDWAYMTFWGEDGVRNAYIGTNAVGDIKVSRDGGCNLELGANAVFNANVSDSIGDLRSIPANTQNSAYSLTGSDAGKCVLAGGQISIPSDVGFVEGDAVTIINNSGSSINFALSASLTLYNTADGTEPSSMGARGMCTIYFVSNTVAYISGSQLS